MTIAAIAARGTAVSSTSSTTMPILPNAAVAVGRQLVLVVSSDNDASATTTAASNRHTSVSDGANTWKKVGEYTNGQSAAAAGVTTSVWVCNVLAALATTSTITINFGTAVLDKCATMHEFSVAAGTYLDFTLTPQYQAVNAAAGFGSSSYSALASKERLYVRGMGKEVSNTTNITPSTGYTVMTNARSRNNTLAMTVYGEFKIGTTTAETSNPTLAVTGDTSSVFIGLEETSYPAASTIVQDFSGTYPPNGFVPWSDSATFQNMDGGTLNQGWTSAAQQSTFLRYDNVSFVGSSSYIRLLRPLQGLTSSDMQYFCALSCGLSYGAGGDGFTMKWTPDGVFRIYYSKAYLDTDLAVLTYDATAHAWWRIRESGGTVFFDTAPSTASNPPVSGDWVNRASVTIATLGWNPNKMQIMAISQCASTPTAAPTGTAQWDGWNAAATVAAASTKPRRVTFTFR
jgi:hypothetical protein